MRSGGVLVVVVAVAVTACAQTSETEPARKGEPTRSAGEASPGEGRLDSPGWTSEVIDRRFCIPESRTVLLEGGQGPPPDPVGECKTWPDSEAFRENTVPCGPCGFVLDSVATREARSRHPDACCYAVSSPPPPPPPPR